MVNNPSDGFDGRPNLPTSEPLSSAPISFSGIRNEPGIKVKPSDETHAERVKQEAAEYIQMLRAQRGSATEHGIAMMSLQGLLEQMTGLVEEARIEQADKTDERLTLEEKRRWHAAASLLQGHGVGWSFELLDDLTRWLKTGERPINKR